MYEETLASCGMQVTAAADAAQAIPAPQAAAPSFDVVLVVGGAQPERLATRILEQIGPWACAGTLPLLLVSPPGASDLDAELGCGPRLRHATGPLSPEQLCEHFLQLLDGEQDAASLPRDASSSPPPQPMNILLADDCLVNQEVATGLLGCAAIVFRWRRADARPWRCSVAGV